MDRFYSLGHSSIDFHFRQTPRDFVVEEIPLYEFSGEGEHLALFVRKKNLSTLELVAIFAKYLGIQNKEIGYEQSAKIAQDAYKNNLSLREAAIKSGIISEETFDYLVNPLNMI